MTERLSNEEIRRLPAREAIKALQTERGWSIRDLSRHIHDRFPGWGSPALLSDYRTGKQRMSVSTLEKLAVVFGVEPDLFSDYRLAVARNQLDPDEVGLDAALRTLERFDLDMEGR